MEASTTVTIDGKRIESFRELRLSQRINDHHTFELVIDQDIVEVPGGHTIERSRQWLARPIVVSFGDKEFLGVVTDVGLAHADGHDGQLTVSGRSKTILLESGRHMQSWLGKKLADIVSDVAGEAGVEAQVDPVHKDMIEYQSQYNETHFQFIRRLAWQYGEFLFYDGLRLVFGRPPAPVPVKVEYGSDLARVNISVRASPNRSSIFSYNALDDARNEATSKDDVAGLDELGAHAFSASNEAFGIVPSNISSARVPDKRQIDARAKTLQAQGAASLSTLTARSRVQGLGIGSTVKVSSAKRDGNGTFDVKGYGEYMITAITHTASSQGVYENTFEAVPSGLEALPPPEVALPVAQPQAAVVVSNEDPEQKGRLQVKFQWQKDPMKTSWLRVMSMDAGKSGKVASNRGLVFVPEVDDTVMVGFRYNDPNRPFVMGAMHNGTTGAGGGADNRTKSITTRSGSTITFDDDQGSVHVADAKQNSFTLDGEGNISANSSASITLSTGESSLTMKSDGTIDISGKDITVHGTESISEQSKKISQNGAEEVSVSSPKKVNVSSDMEVTVNGLSKATVTSSGTTAVEGTIIKLN